MNPSSFTPGQNIQQGLMNLFSGSNSGKPRIKQKNNSPSNHHSLKNISGNKTHKTNIPESPRVKQKAPEVKNSTGQPDINNTQQDKVSTSQFSKKLKNAIKSEANLKKDTEKTAKGLNDSRIRKLEPEEHQVIEQLKRFGIVLPEEMLQSKEFVNQLKNFIENALHGDKSPETIIKNIQQIIELFSGKPSKTSLLFNEGETIQSPDPLIPHSNSSGSVQTLSGKSQSTTEEMAKLLEKLEIISTKLDKKEQTIPDTIPKNFAGLEKHSTQGQEREQNSRPAVSDKIASARDDFSRDNGNKGERDEGQNNRRPFTSLQSGQPNTISAINPNQNATTGEFEESFTFQQLQSINQSSSSKHPISFKAAMGYRNLENSVLNQVTNNLESLRFPSSTEVKITLHPKHLGEVNISLEIEGQVLKGRIIVEKELVKTMMENNLTQLRDTLQQQGIELDSLEVGVGQQKKHSLQDSQADSENSNGRNDSSDQNHSGKPDPGFSFGWLNLTGTDTGRRLGYNSLELIG